MTLHIHRGRWWPIVCPPYGVFLNCQKGCITGAVHSLPPAEQVLGGTQVLSVVQCTFAGYTGFTLTLSPCGGINLYISDTQSVDPQNELILLGWRATQRPITNIIPVSLRLRTARELTTTYSVSLQLRTVWAYSYVRTARELTAM